MSGYWLKMRRFRTNINYLSLSMIVLVQFIIIYSMHKDSRELSYRLKLKQGKDYAENLAKRSTKIRMKYGKKPGGCENMIDVNDLVFKKRVPSAYIIGQIKCGTGTLRHFLSQHPNILVGDRVETAFFGSSRKGMVGEEAHAGMMPISTQFQVGLENAPTYFNKPASMYALAAVYKNETLIIILRDPVVRAVSHFINYNAKVQRNMEGALELFDKQTLTVKGEINSNSSTIKLGLYAKALKRWMKAIPNGRFEVVDGNAFIKNPLSVLQQLEKALHIPRYFNESMFTYVKAKGFYCLKGKNEHPNCMSALKGRKHPTLRKETLTLLREFYKPQDEELFELLGRRLSWA